MASGAPHSVLETDRRRAKRARGLSRQAPRFYYTPPLVAGSSSNCPDWRDWANLTSGPAGLIADRLLSNDVADYLRFRAVCGAWRGSTDDPRACTAFDRRFHPRRWMMVALPRAFDIHSRRCLLNILTGACIHLRQPRLLHRRYVFRQTAEGLLVLCWKVTHIVHLLNPLTGQVTDLPCSNTLPGSTENLRVRSAGLADDSILVVLQLDDTTLAVAKPGDENWTQLKLNDDDRIMSTLPFAGRFYCATAKNIMVVETTAQQQQPQLVAATSYELQKGIICSDRLCLVDNDGEMILTHRFTNGDGDQLLDVYLVDLDAGKTVTKALLGGRAVFIDDDHGNRALSVPAEVSPSICEDTVYCCRCYDKEAGRAELDAYHLVDGRIHVDCRRKRPCSMVDYLACYVAERRQC